LGSGEAGPATGKSDGGSQGVLGSYVKGSCEMNCWAVLVITYEGGAAGPVGVKKKREGNR